MKRPPRYDLPRAAPGPLRLVQLFLNTENHETRRELLATPAEATAWFAEHGLSAAPLRTADVRRIREVRSELRELAASGRAGVALGAAARRARFTIDLETPAVVAAADGADGAIGTILAIVYDAHRDGSWSRLKRCRNCGWAFWDASRSRTAAWCSMQLCGNRAKVRRYQRRRRAREPR